MKKISVFALVALAVAVASAPAAAKSVAMVFYNTSGGLDTLIQVTYTGETPEEEIIVKAQIVNYGTNPPETLVVETFDLPFNYHNQTFNFRVGFDQYMPNGAGVAYFFIDTGEEQEANPSADFLVVRATIYVPGTSSDSFNSPEIIITDSEPEETQTLMCHFADGATAIDDMCCFIVFPQEIFMETNILDDEDAKGCWSALEGSISSVAYVYDEDEMLEWESTVDITVGSKNASLSDLFPESPELGNYAGFLKITYTPAEETPKGTFCGIRYEAGTGEILGTCWQMRREQ